jgi:hypothetical protein
LLLRFEARMSDFNGIMEITIKKYNFALFRFFQHRGFQRNLAVDQVAGGEQVHELWRIGVARTGFTTERKV